MKAILTGHSRGLGAGICAELLGRGIPVLALARRGNKELAARFPDLLVQHELDLSEPQAVAGWLRHDALAGFLAGAPQALLINNAGTVQPVGPLPTQETAALAQAVSLNVTAPLMLAAAFAAAGEARDKRILHVSSGAGRHPYPGWSIYCATKAALDMHAAAAMADGVQGLRVCSLAPGVIDTDMQAEIRQAPLERFPIRERFDALKRDGQLSDAADVATRLVDFLLSESFGQRPVADLRD